MSYLGLDGQDWASLGQIELICPILGYFWVRFGNIKIDLPKLG